MSFYRIGSRICGEKGREQEPEVNKIVCECANVESLWQGKARNTPLFVYIVILHTLANDL